MPCVTGSMLWMNNWQVQSFHALDSQWTTVKTSELALQKTFFSFKIPIHNFHEWHNLFHLNSVHCKHRHWCLYYRSGKTTETQVFTSVKNSYRTLQLAVEKHFSLSKCWFMISHEHSNSFHLNFIYKLQTWASILQRHHSNFRTITNFLIFSKCMWNMIPRAPHDFTH